jgi:ribosome-associated protein
VFANYFILCDGENNRHLGALAASIRQEAKEQGMLDMHIVEGSAESGWILVDINGIIVHVFASEQREYYNLEELWNESHVVLRMP